MVMRRQRGYTMMEIVMTLAVFGVFLMIIIALTMDMKRNEARYPINYMAHPEVAGLIARMRKDIFDTKYYPAAFQGYSQTKKTLILYTLQQTGFAVTVVYDFNTPGQVHRITYNATQQIGDWVARGVPETFEINAYPSAGGQDGVRISARDTNSRLAIDEIFIPRAHD